MNRIALGLCTCSCLLMLGGCVGTSRPVFPRHYTLAVTAVPAHQGRPEPEGHVALRIARITVPPWLQGTNLYYRLDYLDDARVYAYARSDWVSPPATLLEHVVQDTLRADGSWRAVLDPASPARADVSLHIQLNDFSQAFAGPHKSSGILDAMATLVDNRNGNVIAQKHFHVGAAAPSADAAGGVKALDRVSREFAVRLQGWLSASVSSLPSRNTPAQPRQPGMPENREHR